MSLPQKTLSLKKNFSWTLAGNIIYSVCQWGMIILLARLGSPELVGKFSLALAITGPIIMLTNLQLRSVQATDTNETYRFGDYLSVRLITSVIAIIITLIIVIIVGYTFEIALIISIMCIAKVIESISDVAFGLMQKKEVMNKIAISMIFKGLFSLLVFGVTIWVTKNLSLGIIAMALVWLIILFQYDIKNVKEYAEFRPIFNRHKLKNIVKLSLPLGIVLMIGSLTTNIPRYFLEFYINAEALGYYSAMIYFIVIGNTVMNALGQSSSPRLAKYYSQEKGNSFRKLIIKVMGIGLVVGIFSLIISLIFGEIILTIVYGEEYAKYSNIFVLIMLSGAINYFGSILGYGITATRSFKIQPIIGLIWMIVSIIGSYLFIPSFGLTGAAYALILTACVQLLTKVVVLCFLLRTKKGRLI